MFVCSHAPALMYTVFAYLRVCVCVCVFCKWLFWCKNRKNPSVFLSFNIEVNLVLDTLRTIETEAVQTRWLYTSGEVNIYVYTVPSVETVRDTASYVVCGDYGYWGNRSRSVVVKLTLAESADVCRVSWRLSSRLMFIESFDVCRISWRLSSQLMLVESADAYRVSWRLSSQLTLVESADTCRIS